VDRKWHSYLLWQDCEEFQQEVPLLWILAKSESEMYCIYTVTEIMLMREYYDGDNH